VCLPQPAGAQALPALDGQTGGSPALLCPPSAVLKPFPLWTGKQVFDLLLRPNPSVDITVSFEQKVRGAAACGAHMQGIRPPPPCPLQARNFGDMKGQAPYLDPNDGCVIFRGGASCAATWTRRAV